MMNLGTVPSDESRLFRCVRCSEQLGFDCSVHHYFCVNTLWFCPFWVLTRSQLRPEKRFNEELLHISLPVASSLAQNSHSFLDSRRFSATTLCTSHIVTSCISHLTWRWSLSPVIYRSLQVAICDVFFVPNCTHNLCHFLYLSVIHISSATCYHKLHPIAGSMTNVWPYKMMLSYGWLNSTVERVEYGICKNMLKR